MCSYQDIREIIFLGTQRSLKGDQWLSSGRHWAVAQGARLWGPTAAHWLCPFLSLLPVCRTGDGLCPAEVSRGSMPGRAKLLYPQVPGSPSFQGQATRSQPVTGAASIPGPRRSSPLASLKPAIHPVGSVLGMQISFKDHYG